MRKTMPPSIGRRLLAPFRWVRAHCVVGLASGFMWVAGGLAFSGALSSDARAATHQSAAATSASADRVDTSWEQTRHKHGIRVFKRDMPDSKLLSFKAVGIIDAPIDIVLSIILDQERLSEWAEDRSSSRVLQWIDAPVEYVSYDRIELPWPIKDRDFVTRVRISVDPDDATTRVSYSASNRRVRSPKDVVRGSLVGSYYVLEPVDGGRKTRATGVAVADPRGSIPAWVVNLYQRNWPYDTIMAMREQAKKTDVKVLDRLAPLYVSLRQRLRGGRPPQPANKVQMAASGGSDNASR